jgi:hypothetical protein
VSLLVARGALGVGYSHCIFIDISSRSLLPLLSLLFAFIL